MKNQQTQFAIGIPTINRADLLQPALEKYSRDFQNTAIYIVDNGHQQFDTSRFGPNVFFTSNETNAGVSGSWNQLLDKIYNGVAGFTEGARNAVMLNDDIYLGLIEYEIASFIIKSDYQFAVSEQNWCIWMMPEIVHRKVGAFDETFFPAYYEDNDYYMRLKLAGFKPEKYPLLNPKEYRNSATIEKDPSLNTRFDLNKQHYIDKWGGEPGNETFLVPYNQI